MFIGSIKRRFAKGIDETFEKLIYEVKMKSGLEFHTLQYVYTTSHG
jgi:hypothetical protein